MQKSIKVSIGPGGYHLTSPPWARRPCLFYSVHFTHFISIPRTGHIHLNGLRVALFNYLFAKAKNGKMIVRIDDIDHMVTANDAHQKRIFRQLEWAGVVADESAIHGGSFGPYIQSQRLEIYQRRVKELLENGSAYYCFCTEKRLEGIQPAEADIGTKYPSYDNRCRDLGPLQVATHLANKVHPMRIR